MICRSLSLVLSQGRRSLTLVPSPGEREDLKIDGEVGVETCSESRRGSTLLTMGETHGIQKKLKKDIPNRGCGIEVEILFGGTTKRLQRIARSNVTYNFQKSTAPKNYTEKENN